MVVGSPAATAIPDVARLFGRGYPGTLGCAVSLAPRVALGDELYLCGGSSKNASGALEPDTSIEVYDPRQDAWRTLTVSLPAGMRQVQAFAMRGRLVVVSSHVEGDPKLRVAVITP